MPDTNKSQFDTLVDENTEDTSFANTSRSSLNMLSHIYRELRITNYLLAAVLHQGDDIDNLRETFDLD